MSDEVKSLSEMVEDAVDNGEDPSALLVALDEAGGDALAADPEALAEAVRRKFSEAGIMMRDRDTLQDSTLESVTNSVRLTQAAVRERARSRAKKMN